SGSPGAKPRAHHLDLVARRTQWSGHSPRFGVLELVDAIARGGERRVKVRRMELHLVGLHLHLACLHLHFRYLNLRRMELPLRCQQFAGQMLAIALRGAKVLAQVIELRGNRSDLMLELHARRRMTAFDTRGEKLRQRQRHDLDFALFEIELLFAERWQRVRQAARARSVRQWAQVQRAVACRIHQVATRVRTGVTAGAPRCAIPAAASSASFHFAGAAFHATVVERGTPARRSGKAPSAEATMGTPDCSATDSVYA